MQEEIIRDALVRANRLGFQGIEVIGYREAESAADDSELTLFTQLPRVKTSATDD